MPKKTPRTMVSSTASTSCMSRFAKKINQNTEHEPVKAHTLTKKKAHIGAVIIAAGQGLRMGRGFGHENGHCKPCMPLGEYSILANVMKCLQAGVTGPIVVVTGYHQEAVTAEAQRLGLHTVHNEHPERGMLSSMQAGFAAILDMTKNSSRDYSRGLNGSHDLDSSHGLDGVFLLPADIPTVRPSTCTLLAEDFHEHRASITYPIFKEERGHPPILARHIMEEALHYDGQGGLRSLLLQIEEQGHMVRHVFVADEGILRDMDTVADHAQIVARHAMHHIPTPLEREALLDMAGTPSHTQAHCAMVARAALVMAVHLDATEKGYMSAFRKNTAPVCADGGNAVDHSHREMQNMKAYENLLSQAPLYDRPLIHAAGMLHDICKGSKRHEEAGGAFLRRHGFAEIADIVAAHRDVNKQNPCALTASHLVMLADKYIRGDRLVPIEERYDERIRQWASQPDVVRDIQGRKDRALALTHAFEDAANVELYPLLQLKLKGLAC